MVFGNSSALNEGDIGVVLKADGTVTVTSAVTSGSLEGEHAEQIRDNMLIALGIVQLCGTFEGQRLLRDAGSSDEAIAAAQKAAAGEITH